MDDYPVHQLAEPIRFVARAIATRYGMEADWRHGMYEQSRVPFQRSGVTVKIEPSAHEQPPDAPAHRREQPPDLRRIRGRQRVEAQRAVGHPAEHAVERERVEVDRVTRVSRAPRRAL